MSKKQGSAPAAKSDVVVESAEHESGPVKTQTVESIMKQLAENAGGKLGARIKNRTYEIKLGNMENNFAPQCRQVLSVLLGLAMDDKGQIKQSTMVKELAIANEMERCASEFQTVQGPWKLFQYYRKQLVDAGWLREIPDSDEPVEGEEV